MTWVPLWAIIRKTNFGLILICHVRPNLRNVPGHLTQQEALWWSHYLSRLKCLPLQFLFLPPLSASDLDLKMMRCACRSALVSAPLVQSIMTRPHGHRSATTFHTRSFSTEAEKQRMELNKFLYDIKPASTIQGEVQMRPTPCDSTMPVPAPHPGLRTTQGSYVLKNPMYTPEEVQAVKITHRPVQTMLDKMAFGGVTVARTAFDKLTGYPDLQNERDWLHRIIFLETVAGVPGMVGGMMRHYRSLRKLQRDHGWIHTLLEEAENERMHLLTFMKLRQPGIMFRMAVVVTQGIFANLFFLAYIISPKLCHRFVGYLEEEAVRTYTHLLHVIDEPGSVLQGWNQRPAPNIAKEYWRLADDASLRDVIEMVRADEACHRHVNHVFSSIDADQHNPFGPYGKKELGVAPCEKEVKL